MREDWTYRRFDEVFDLQMGKTPDRENPLYFVGSNVWVSIRDMVGKYIGDSIEHISDTAVSIKKIHKVKKGTVIMSFKLTVGKCAIAKKDLYTNEAIMAFNLKNGYEINSNFLYYYLKGYNWKGTNKAVKGITLNKATISKQVMCFPKIPEQERIVLELDLLASIIDKKKEQLKEYDKLAQSIFYDMFGDPIQNEKGWEVKKLEDVCISIIRGPFGSALKKEFFVEPSKTTYKIYEQKHAIQKNAMIGSYYVTEEKFKELSRFELKPDDIIMSCSGTIGEFYKLPKDAEKGLMNQALLKFRLNNQVSFDFFIFMMEYLKKSFIVRGSGLKNIGSVKIIKSMSLGLPPLSLQQSFAEKVEAIEKQKTIIQQSINETQILFNSRMDYYFG